MPGPRPTHRLVATGAAALLAAVGLFSLPRDPAGAAVTPHQGFRATVDGFTSWYGSYAMGPIGTAWCIDHGIAAPDPAYRYVPTDLPLVPAATRTAVAWALGRHGHGADPVTHAALMLVLHDLMGATYPSGRLDVHRLRAERLAGFGGHEAEVLRRARYLKGEALARGVLQGPLRLDVALRPAPDGTATATARLRDAADRPVPAVEVELRGLPGGPIAGRTGADGTWRTDRHRVTGPVTARAVAIVPRLSIEAWAPTTRRAQRVARPATERLEATAHLAPPPTTTTTVPPTTTSTTTTTTTTAPPTTTTTMPPTTTIPTTTTTLAPSTTQAPTTTPTSAPPTAPAPTVPPTVAAGPPAGPALPRTGTDALAWALVGLGLVLLGGAAQEASRAAR